MRAECGGDVLTEGGQDRQEMALSRGFAVKVAAEYGDAQGETEAGKGSCLLFKQQGIPERGCTLMGMSQ